MGNYWICWEYTAALLTEIDLISAPRIGESIWFPFRGDVIHAQVADVVHVCKSNYDEARVEIYVAFCEEYDLEHLKPISDEEKPEEVMVSWCTRCQREHCGERRSPKVPTKQARA